MATYLEMYNWATRQGLKPITLKSKEKIPKYGKEWKTKICPVQDFVDEKGNDKNVNMGLMGPDLVDIDLDCPEAVKYGKALLPNSKLIYGKPSSGAAHYLYRCKGKDVKTVQFASQVGEMPNATKEKPTTMIVEFRHLEEKFQSMIPPSKHPNGETLQVIRIDNTLDYVDHAMLMKRVRMIVACVILEWAWGTGSRQDSTMCLTGGLLHAGWPVEEIRIFMEVFLRRCGDDEVDSRLRAMETTISKFEDGENVTGFKTLKDKLGDRTVSRVIEILEIHESTEFKSGEIVVAGNNLVQITYVKGKPNEKLIATFNPIPKQVIELDGQDHIEIEYVTDSGSRTVETPPSVFNSCARFKSFITENLSSAANYYGNDVDTMKIRKYLSDEIAVNDVKTIKGVDRVGMYGNTYVDYERSLDLGGEKNTMKALHNYRFQCGLAVRKVVEDKEQFKDCLINFNDPVITHAFWGFVGACFYRTIFDQDERFSGFPSLFMIGAAGSGKSQTAEILARVFNLSTDFVGISQMTPYVLQLSNDSSNMHPLIMDEFKPSEINAATHNRITATIRDNYTGISAQKGQKNMSYVEFKRIRPIVICGEGGFSQQAISERAASLEFGRDDSYQRADKFNKLKKTDLEGLGALLLQGRLHFNEEDFETLIKDYEPNIDHRLVGRPRSNALLLKIGLTYVYFALGDQVAKDFDLDMIDKAILQTMGADDSCGFVDTKTAAVKMLESMNAMAQRTGTDRETLYYRDLGLTEGIDYRVMDGTHLVINLQNCTDVFGAWAKKYDYKGDILRKEDFSKQLRKEKCVVEKSASVKYGGVNIKSIKINIEEALKNNWEIGTFIQRMVTENQG